MLVDRTFTFGTLCSSSYRGRNLLLNSMQLVVLIHKLIICLKNYIPAWPPTRTCGHICSSQRCGNMRDIMLQYCWVRARSHTQCSFPVVHMAGIKVLSWVSTVLVVSWGHKDHHKNSIIILILLSEVFYISVTKSREKTEQQRTVKLHNTISSFKGADVMVIAPLGFASSLLSVDVKEIRGAIHALLSDSCNKCRRGLE